ncbi:MAG: AIR synthase family protein [Candidatus Hodarchaeota archaeon]
MLAGKVPPDILESIVFKYLGKRDPDLILGPGLGEDASLIRIGDQVLVAATDPITGSIADIGWLSVHINANDIATFGVAPRWFLASILLPPSTTPNQLKQIVSQIDEAAKSLGISVAGGHSEITEGITRPIIAGFMLGSTTQGMYVTSSGGRPGDHIIMTKSAAIEGTAILATEGEDFLIHEVGKDKIEAAKRMREDISVVKEALAAFDTGHLTAMHDPTEGGISGGLHEICDASNTGFSIDLSKIPITEATEEICKALSINPLELISSGSMIMTCKAESSDDVVKAVQDVGVKASVIGEMNENPEIRTIKKVDSVKLLPRPKTDSLWDALAKINPS